MATSKKHTHKYQRVEVPWGKIWACALPNCSHYMPKASEAFLDGKATLCWGCDKTVLMTEDIMEYAIKREKEDKDNGCRPLCYDCQARELGRPTMNQIQEIADSVKIK